MINIDSAFRKILARTAAELLLSHAIHAYTQKNSVWPAINGRNSPARDVLRNSTTIHFPRVRLEEKKQPEKGFACNDSSHTPVSFCPIPHSHTPEKDKHSLRHALFPALPNPQCDGKRHAMSQSHCLSFLFPSQSLDSFYVATPASSLLLPVLQYNTS